MVQLNIEKYSSLKKKNLGFVFQMYFSYHNFPKANKKYQILSKYKYSIFYVDWVNL